MRTVLSSCLTLASMLVLNLLLAWLVHIQFINLSFFIGVLFLAFSGTTAIGNREKSELTFNDYQYQEKTGFNVDRHKPLFLPNAPFFTALLYILVCLTILLIRYRHAFFG